MKALVVYDSAYGNTRSVAETIAGSLGGLQARSVPVGDFKPDELAAGDLLVVGLCGHGLQIDDPASKQKAPFFCPRDAKPADPRTLTTP